MYYVKHKNPNIPATDYGEKWAYDGPFSHDGAEEHARRCEYRTRGIEHEIVPAKDVPAAGNGNGAEPIGLDDFLDTQDEEE